MNIITHEFVISRSKKLVIKIPELNEKINYFYEATESLNQFDECQINYIDEHSSRLIYQEVLGDAIHRLYYQTKIIMENSCDIYSSLEPGKVGYACYKYISKDGNITEEDPYKFFMWGSIWFDTFLYSCDDKIYLEIDESYRKGTVKKNSCKVLEIVSLKTIKQWHIDARKLLKKLNVSFNT